MPIPVQGPQTAAARTLNGPAPSGASARGGEAESDLSFGDVLDIINPLQHIPIVNSIYREITGDQASVVSKVAGGALFGGVFGFVASLIDGIVETATGKDTGSHLVALLRSGEQDFGPDTSQGTDVASLENWGGERGEGDDLRQVASAETIGDDDIEYTPASAPQHIAPVQAQAQAKPAVRSAGDDTRALANLYQSRNASQPQPLHSSVSLNGVRGAAFTGLPAPQTVAANPNLITAARNAPGSGVNKTVAAQTAGWVRLMEAAEGARSNATGGLAQATIAKAMASYGAGSAGVNRVSAFAASRR
jgi:hypothetical protein